MPPSYRSLNDENPLQVSVSGVTNVLGSWKERGFSCLNENSSCRYKVGASGVKQAEPRLQTKRHRRQSRKTVRQSLDEKLWEKMEEQAEVEDVLREN